MRVRKGSARRRKHKRILKQAKGYCGARSKLYRIAKQQLMRSWAYAYRDRKARKRDFRKLWIIRINAACRKRGITYSQFIFALKQKGIAINRKMLAELSVKDPRAFDALVDSASD